MKEKLRNNLKNNLRKSLNNNLNNRGITLIALVVTIIILLILAGVSISMVFNSDGLFSKANEAGTRWNNSKEEEEDFLEQATNDVDKYWNKYGGNEKTLVSMFKKAQDDNCLDGKNCNNPGEHVHVGDYVTNYNSTLKNASAEATLLPEETGMITETNEANRITQVYKVDTSTTWRVAGLSKDGTQLIITTGSPIKKQMNTTSDNEYLKDPYLYLRGAEGWYHTNDELTNDNILDRASKIYDSRYASKISSMRIEDIETLLGLSIEKNGANIKAYKTNGENRTDITEVLEHYIGKSYTYKETNRSPENYLKKTYPSNPKYTSLQSKNTGDSVEGSEYKYDMTNSKAVGQSSKIFEILFKDTSSTWAKAYWLASSGVGVFDVICTFGPGVVMNGGKTTMNGGINLYGSGGGKITFEFGVRPVVYLQSNVSTNELTISSDGSEEPWTTPTPTPTHRRTSITYIRLHKF